VPLELGTREGLTRAAARAQARDSPPRSRVMLKNSFLAVNPHHNTRDTHFILPPTTTPPQSELKARPSSKPQHHHPHSPRKMPGLLQSDESSASRLYAAIAAEVGGGGGEGGGVNKTPGWPLQPQCCCCCCCCTTPPPLQLVCSLLFAFFGAPGAGAAGNAVLLAVLGERWSAGREGRVQDQRRGGRSLPLPTGAAPL
jgi:hypothetical protein